MNKLLLFFTFLFLLFACTHKKAKYRAQEIRDVPAVTDSLELDSSIVSLKSFNAVPLLEAIGQLWKMDDADQKYWNYLMWDSAENKRKYPELALYSDFSATENARCKVHLGKWKIDKNKRELLLNFSDGTNGKYTIKKILLQKMVVSKKIGEDEVKITFVSDGLVQKEPADDPFYPSNNRWRIKPKHPETDEQILDRVKQCVHFYSLFFSDTHQRASTEISYSGLPTCFEWYNGGIGVPQELDLDKKWIDCFYSEKEALKGYHLIRTLIEKHVLVWPEHPTSWIEQTHEMLDQLYDKL